MPTSALCPGGNRAAAWRAMLCTMAASSSLSYRQSLCPAGFVCMVLISIRMLGRQWAQRRELFGGQGFLFQQQLGTLLQLGAATLQQGLGPRIGTIDQGSDAQVDLARGLL